MILVGLEVRNVRDGYQQNRRKWRSHTTNVETDFGLEHYLLLLCGNYCLQDLYKDKRKKIKNSKWCFLMVMLKCVVNIDFMPASFQG
jgi:hypothetical protein